MFRQPRKTPEVPETLEVRKTLLTNLDDEIHNSDLDNAEKLAKIYKTIMESVPSAEKRGVSDHVKVAYISAAASVIGILAVIRHEDVNVIASKALNFVVKPKV